LDFTKITNSCSAQSREWNDNPQTAREIFAKDIMYTHVCKYKNNKVKLKKRKKETPLEVGDQKKKRHIW
jgi:hypothetical protein